jgi:hypothetical protein
MTPMATEGERSQGPCAFGLGNLRYAPGKRQLRWLLRQYTYLRSLSLNSEAILFI